MSQSWCSLVALTSRAWLESNADTSEGVWLVFGKTSALVTLSANDALEEALCFGWIDGQMRSIDQTRYHKYFARRRASSVWSDRNKCIVETLRIRGLLAPQGEQAITTARANGAWNPPKPDLVTVEQVEAFTARLVGFDPAHDNFCAMSASVRATYTRRYLSFKTEAARERDFLRIIDRLNRNLKSM